MEAMFDDELVSELIGASSVSAELVSAAEMQAVDLQRPDTVEIDRPDSLDARLDRLRADYQDTMSSEQDSDDMAFV